MSTFFFFNDTATTEIYTLSLHDALPISNMSVPIRQNPNVAANTAGLGPLIQTMSSGISLRIEPTSRSDRSEEHTSELQSQSNLVCRLLLEKKKNPLHISTHARHRLHFYR